MIIACKKCKVEYELPISELAHLKYVQGGELVQNAFPQLSVDERELLISRICGKCFDKLFKGKD